MSTVKWHWAELFVDGFHKAHKVVLASDYDTLRAEAERLRGLIDQIQKIVTHPHESKDALAARVRNLLGVGQ